MSEAANILTAQVIGELSIGQCSDEGFQRILRLQSTAERLEKREKILREAVKKIAFTREGRDWPVTSARKAIKDADAI